MDIALTNNDVAIHYELIGQGYPLVMLHGQFMNTTMFDCFDSEMMKHFQLIKIDLRGHGYSDKPLHIKMDDYVEDVLTVLDKLYIKDAHFMGFGLGGAVAATIASKYPRYVNKLILISTGIKSYYEAEREFHDRYASILRTMSRKERNKVLEDYMYHDIKTVKKYYKRMKDTQSGMTEKEEDAVIISTIDYNPRKLDVIEVKTLVMNGRHDELVPIEDAQTLASLLPASRLSIYEESGHGLLFEQFDEFVKEVNMFLQN
ncbi:alpha/beta fold hydrolase [Macrococcoides caseolyticum]|uniref:alpha/beta fold hydrolase n=1 Tax=Macrococcoides caseolyticum TaxID=69966 RepID=UPI001F1746D7|nr:alpha/beta hydrolase [Macrococcus caseolyticus]MCE4957773.1 alpha/beta hydrolase [Macrococcus caseolyticus]